MTGDRQDRQQEPVVRFSGDGMGRWVRRRWDVGMLCLPRPRGVQHGRQRAPLEEHRRGAMNRRIPQLDLLRAVAILLVIGRHLELPRPDGVVGVVAEGWYRVGWIGVDLFFVLSGFLIGGLLINESRAHGSVDIRRFLVRRGLKIYPAYFVFLAYLIFLPVVRAQLHGRSATAELGEQLSTSWPHLVFVQNYSDVDTAQHLWSIGVEEHFYLLLPFVVAALALRHSSKLIVIGLASVLVFLVIRVISVATADPYSEHMTATHLRLDALLLGVALRAILEHYPEWFAGLRGWRLPLVVLGLACWAPNLVIAPESTRGLVPSVSPSRSWALPRSSWPPTPRRPLISDAVGRRSSRWCGRSAGSACSPMRSTSGTSPRSAPSTRSPTARSGPGSAPASSGGP